MSDEPKTFKYKLDFYYLSPLIYLITMVLYGGIRGSFVEKKFEYVLDDPLMYLIVFFVLMSLVMLVLNVARNRALMITKDAIIFHHRWQDRRVKIADIEWIHIGRESRVQTGGVFQAVVFKLKGRRRLYRIRVGRYERNRELLQEMQRIATVIPVRKQPRWRRLRITDR